VLSKNNVKENITKIKTSTSVTIGVEVIIDEVGKLGIGYPNHSKYYKDKIFFQI
jgi:hypothetical protein